MEAESAVSVAGLKRALECPVCFETPKAGPLYQCENGHKLTIQLLPLRQLIHPAETFTFQYFLSVIDISRREDRGRAKQSKTTFTTCLIKNPPSADEKMR